MRRQSSSYKPHPRQIDRIPAFPERKSLCYSTRHDCFFGGDFNGHHRLWKRGARTNTAGKSVVAALIERPDLLPLTPKDAITRINPCIGRPSTKDLSFAFTSLASNFNYSIEPYLGSDHFPVIIQLNVAPNRTQSRAPNGFLTTRNGRPRTTISHTT